MATLQASAAVRRAIEAALGYWPECVVFLVTLGAFFVFPYDLGFLTRILIMMVFALSLDLILGYAGIDSLGHAAMYGTGAYAAGLFAIHVSNDPLIGLLAGALSGALIALISGLVLMRAHGLTLLILSIAVAAMLQDVALKARSLTGGADGLSGITMGPLLGRFEFDFVGQTGFWYAFCVLLVVLVVLKSIVASPFGLTIRGINESRPRMRAIGTPVYSRLVTVYTIAGAIAGVAGALSAQVTALVSIESYNFALSAEVMVMLILGGTGRLYGALLGTLVFMVVHHVAASVDPFNWLFVIGGMILVVVFFAPAGIISLLDKVPGLGRKLS